MISAGNLEPNPVNIEKIKTLANDDKHSQVRAQAVALMASTGDAQYKDAIVKAMTSDRSYSVQSAALAGLKNIDPEAALSEAKKLESSENTELLSAVAAIYTESGDPQYLPFFEKSLRETDGFDAIGFYENYGKLVIAGDKDALTAGAEKMQEIGSDLKASPFQRFAATKTLNDFYLAAHDRAVGATDDAVKTEMTALKTRFAEAIEAIKTKETEPQLKTFYSGFPTPTN